MAIRTLPAPEPLADAAPALQPMQVYAMAGVCLLLGLAIGYLLRESVVSAPPAPVAARTVARPGGPGMPAGHMPSLNDMKRMADKQAAPLLEKLKSNPQDAAVLTQVGAIYRTTHQFKEAADYYGRAAAAKPDDLAIRTKFASSLFRSGDTDGAIAQLNRVLNSDPANANALFDLGMIQLDGKQDSKGALALWRKLLKTNPQLSPDRKAEVQKLIANVMSTQGGGQSAPRSAQP